MRKADVIKLIRENREKLKEFGVKRIGLFGSVVRDQASEGSDVDIVVDFERGKATFRNVGRLIEFLENLFNTEIDLLTPYGIESIRIKSVKERIKQEVEYV